MFIFIEYREVAICVAYISPNNDVTTFERKVDEIMHIVQNRREPALTAGDFNAIATLWGSVLEHRRGSYLSE